MIVENLASHILNIYILKLDMSYKCKLWGQQIPCIIIVL